jgi:monoamine oxidase
LYYVRRALANATGEDMTRISARAARAEMHDRSAGAGDFRILDGYDCLLDWLAQGLDIRLNTVVQAVGWRGDGVRVQTADGPVYEAARALITLPLGVLQAGDVRFDPPLPASKQAAIDGLLMGPGLKMMYRFDEPVLPAHIGAVYSARSPPMWWSPSFGRGIDDFQVWTAFATGPWARELLALGADSALAQGLATLRHEIDQPGITPAAMHLMSWSGEAFTRGGYSVIPPGGVGLRQALAAPVDSRLYWAGEATAPDVWAATVHGAYESGRRAAAEILAKKG